MGWYADRFFPWLIERLEGPEVHALRERCVAPARGRVVEIGFGTGKTLPHYGDAVDRLAIVEPSAGMNRRTAALLERAPFPTQVEAIRGEALPFEGGTFDSAVCTMTLCSVDDPAAVLGELRRVLKPNGTYHFLEHVLSDDPGIARRQRRFNPIQRRIGCGCNLIRDTETAIRTAGFEIVEIERLVSPGMPGLDPRMYPLILGTARPTAVRT